MSDRDNLGEVELEPNQNTGSHFFIEATTSWSLITTVVMLIAFLGIHGFAALRSPPCFANKEEYFKMNSTENNVSIDVDIVLSQLQDLHRFVVVNASLVRKDAKQSSTLPIDMTAKWSSMYNFNSVMTDMVYADGVKYELKWDEGMDKSNWFTVVKVPVKAIDRVQVRMTVRTDFDNIGGFLFHWEFANPSADKYQRSAKLLMSFFIGYMLVIFAFYLKFDAESFTQIFLLILGIAGVFASNPLALLLSKSHAVRVSDHILQSVFYALFRMFFIIQLELLRTHEQKPKKMFTVICGIFFLFYATADAAADYDRHSYVESSEGPVSVILPTEKARMAIDIGFFVCSMIWACVAWVQNEGVNTRRLVYFCTCALLSGVATIITNVCMVLKTDRLFSIVPEMCLNSVILTLAAFCLFLLQSGGGPEYKQMEDGKDQEAMILDVEGQSDDDDNDSEEDDEEEE